MLRFPIGFISDHTLFHGPGLGVLQGVEAGHYKILLTAPETQGLSSFPPDNLDRHLVGMKLFVCTFCETKMRNVSRREQYTMYSMNNIIDCIVDNTWTTISLT